jgi:hypothetical protein
MGKTLEPDVLEINGELYRITEDPWTGDFCVDSPEELTQGQYFLTKQGAINYCLYKSGMVNKDEVEYEFAPDRTSA